MTTSRSNSAFVEPGLIGAAILIVAIWGIGWPGALPVGRIVLYLAVIFLLHTLIRDLVLLARSRRKGEYRPGRKDQVFCVESGIGIIVVLIGLALFLANVGGMVSLSHTGWTVAIGALLIVNYLIRDLVFSWNPWRIYRDPNHLNIVPQFSRR